MVIKKSFKRTRGFSLMTTMMIALIVVTLTFALVYRSSYTSKQVSRAKLKNNLSRACQIAEEYAIQMLNSPTNPSAMGVAALDGWTKAYYNEVVTGLNGDMFEVPELKAVCKLKAYAMVVKDQLGRDTRAAAIGVLARSTYGSEMKGSLSVFWPECLSGFASSTSEIYQLPVFCAAIYAQNPNGIFLPDGAEVNWGPVINCAGNISLAPAVGGNGMNVKTWPRKFAIGRILDYYNDPVTGLGLLRPDIGAYQYTKVDQDWSEYDFVQLRSIQYGSDLDQIFKRLDFDELYRKSTDNSNKLSNANNKYTQADKNLKDLENDVNVQTKQWMWCNLENSGTWNKRGYLELKDYAVRDHPTMVFNNWNTNKSDIFYISKGTPHILIRGKSFIGTLNKPVLFCTTDGPVTIELDNDPNNPCNFFNAGISIPTNARQEYNCSEDYGKSYVYKANDYWINEFDTAFNNGTDYTCTNVFFCGVFIHTGRGALKIINRTGTPVSFLGVLAAREIEIEDNGNPINFYYHPQIEAAVGFSSNTDDFVRGLDVIRRVIDRDTTIAWRMKWKEFQVSEDNFNAGNFPNSW
ncbi:MAG: hypothetical protein ABII27_09815 [bacterium]